MNPKTLGIGVIEWKVYGYGEFVDRSALKNAIATAKGINTNLFVEGSKYLLDLAIAKAQAVLSDTAATQEQVDAAAAELNAVIAGLESADGNLAYSAAVTTSLLQLGVPVRRERRHRPFQLLQPVQKPRYGTWGNRSSYETVTLHLGQRGHHRLHRPLSVVRRHRGRIHQRRHSGAEVCGIRVPRCGRQLEVRSQRRGPRPQMDKFNKTTFDPFTTTALRVKLNSSPTTATVSASWSGRPDGRSPAATPLPTAVKVVIARIDAIGESHARQQGRHRGRPRCV